MKRVKKVVSIALVACLLLALLPSAAFAGNPAGNFPFKLSYLPGVEYPTFLVGDTSSADKLMFTISGNERTTDSGVEKATAVWFDWWITDLSGGKFEYFETSTGQPIAQLPTMASPTTTSAQSLSIYVGVKPGVTLTAADNQQATLNVRMNYTVAYGTSSSETPSIVTPDNPDSYGTYTSSGWYNTYPSGNWYNWYNVYRSATQTLSINVSTVYTGTNDSTSDSLPTVSNERSEYMKTQLNEILQSASTVDAILTSIRNLQSYDYAAFVGNVFSDNTNNNVLAQLEQAVLAKLGKSTLNTTFDVGSSNFNVSGAQAIGAGFSANANTTSLELKFATPQAPNLGGTTAGIIYETASVVPIDITLFVNDSWYLTNPTVPIRITVPVPSGLETDSAYLEVLHQKSDGSWERLYSSVYETNGQKYCTFWTTSFSTFAFVKRTGYASSDSSRKSSDTPTPIVPILYDIMKSGDSFTFKTFIANASGNMAGATVSVKLNGKYATTVTIGQDGVGLGTLEAQGFAGTIANFSARVNGISSASVTKPMIVSSSGRVIAR